MENASWNIGEQFECFTHVGHRINRIIEVTLHMHNYHGGFTHPSHWLVGSNMFATDTQSNANQYAATRQPFKKYGESIVRMQHSMDTAKVHAAGSSYNYSGNDLEDSIRSSANTIGERFRNTTDPPNTAMTFTVYHTNSQDTVRTSILPELKNIAIKSGEVKYSMNYPYGKLNGHYHENTASMGDDNFWSTLTIYTFNVLPEHFYDGPQFARARYRYVDDVCTIGSFNGRTDVEDIF